MPIFGTVTEHDIQEKIIQSTEYIQIDTIPRSGFSPGKRGLHFCDFYQYDFSIGLFFLDITLGDENWHVFYLARHISSHIGICNSK